MVETLSLYLLIVHNKVRKIFISHMKCTFMKHRELLEFFTYLPYSLRYKHLLLQKWKSDTLYERSPFLEAEGLESKELHNPLIQNSLEKIDKMDSPRVIKTHLPFEFLPPNLLDICKVIYVARNPKDCCVSWVYFSSYRVSKIKIGKFLFWTPCSQ